MVRHRARAVTVSVWVAASVALAAATASFATPFMMLACFSYLCMLGGLRFRGARRTHVRFMLVAMALDLGLVLLLELQRGAVATALAFRLSPLQQVHIGASFTAVAFYVPVLVLGALRYRGVLTGGASRAWHIRLGLAAFGFRTLGFMSMYSLLRGVDGR